ncbi:site-specific integrase [Providencia rettgeri]|uniref:site-specific integrase n=1 Tax=Providencia TaxID=586 RepID=UPI002349126C|nr:site-specific integrase [Providencia sp. PROV257]EJF7711344.1 site-specific integrase [Providencia rettgeri]ELR5289088.1 site-specific integrase [Providencia rettgeri]MDT5429289.1 site-specific integrase [Providencia rettgeri]
MSKSIVYPTGVENHGGFLRIWFIYQGKRYREATGLPDTPKNRKQAGEIRQSVQYEIRSGIFDYYHRFPESKNAGNFSTKTVKQITVKDMFSKWLELKKPEISLNTYNRYICKLDTCAMILGEKKHIDAITQENLLFLRNELLTGNHRPARQRKVIKKGRTVATVNDYIVCIKGVLRFAYENGYIDKDPTTSIKKLKKSRTPPDPFSQDEFGRFIEACTNLQSKNLWTVAFYTGIRPGELSALAWEDVDLDAGTITVRRNWTAAKQYTLPKTNAGTDRVIVLLEPAINALKAQMPLTYMRESVKVDVRLREFGKIRKDKCTFIFDPSINARGYAIKSGRYSTTTLGDMWDRTIKKAKIRHRNAYQTRHTYACWMLSAGANPSFLATQMGHSSAQMIFTVYGDWMPENNNDQVEMLNSKLSNNAPSMPHKLKVV